MKKIVFAFSAFALSLLIAFLWKETLDIDQPINDEKFGNFFTALGAVAAAISIYFLYNQIIEMRDARRAASQPDLYLAYCKFQVTDIPDPNMFANDGTKPAVKVVRLNDNQPQENLRPYIELYNIGLGAAKDVHLEWIYSQQEVIALIQGIYQYFDGAAIEKEHIDFLQANGKINIKVPGFYFLCLGEQLNQDFLDILEPQVEKPKPPLTLKIRYKDIQNNQYEKSFKVNVEAFTQFVDLKFASDR